MSQMQKSILIGGLTGGIGYALAKKLEADGWRIGGFARSAEQIEVLRARHPAWLVLQADATQSKEMTAVVQATLATWNHLDAYAHCIGSVFLKPCHLTTDEEWQQVLLTNLTSAFYAARAVLLPMQQARQGSIVLCSSVAARIGLANHEAIAAAKGGLQGLVLSLSATYAGKGIRINAIAPGLVETPATASLTQHPLNRAMSEKMHPLGRLGRAEEAAALMAWLAGPESTWMTGQIIGLDGGMGSIVPRPKA